MSRIVSGLVITLTLTSLIHEGAFAGYPAPAVPLAA